MTNCLIRFLLFSGIFFVACSSDYKALHSIPPDLNCINKFQPKGVKTAWYKTSIDVIGKHISGLLFIKDMPDSSKRIVFTNEAGLKFLDFEFSSNKSFRVHYIFNQLDKKPVIRLLQKDFALMLALPFKRNEWLGWQNNNDILYGVIEKQEKHYFITDKDCASLQRVESGSKRKRMVSLFLFGADRRQPDSMYLRHHTFAMEIKLRKLIKE
jgi:hypothetical protein